MDPERDEQKTEVRETKQETPTGETRRTVTTSKEPTEPTTAEGPVVAARIVYYLGGAVIVLLTVRLILLLLGANRGNPFADFILDLSAIFAAPFFGLFGYEPSYGVSLFELSTLVAIIIYAILTVGIAKLFTIARK